MSLRYSCLCSVLLVATLATLSNALTRYISDPTDETAQAVSERCGGFRQANFIASRCPALMRCVLDGLPSDSIAGYQSGGSIAGLLPTILALIAASPLELVQLAFLSPHRALTTACFGIGLPAGLFRQLRDAGISLTDLKPNEPQTREWMFRLPPTRSSTNRGRWEAAGLTLLVDAIIFGLAAVAFWFCYRVSSRVMITWRCEYGWLVLMWPVACIIWLFLSLLILWALSESITVELHAFDRTKRLSLAQLALLPYRNPSTVTQHYMGLETGEVPKGERNEPSTIVPIAAAPIVANVPTDGQGPPSQAKILLSISMPPKSGLRSWRWYEAIIETLAVGVYLYATFVLTSTQFLSGNTALTYVTIMALCSSAVRILESIFWSPRR